MDGGGPANPLGPQRSGGPERRTFLACARNWAQPKGKKVRSDGFAKGTAAAIGHRPKQEIDARDEEEWLVASAYVRADHRRRLGLPPLTKSLCDRSQHVERPDTTRPLALGRNRRRQTLRATSEKPYVSLSLAAHEIGPCVSRIWAALGLDREPYDDGIRPSNAGGTATRRTPDGVSGANGAMLSAVRPWTCQQTLTKKSGRRSFGPPPATSRECAERTGMPKPQSTS
jgi:hypothetical protein